ncbi:MAG: 2-phospho-L-lactate transferase [Candidatus Acidiferrales bacterium]
MKITALAGGIGASKLLLGLYRVMDPEDLTIIVNTGDDIDMHGLSISPDVDIVTYTLAGVVNPKTGWGYRDETFQVLELLKGFGRAGWFQLGDKDFATHIHRTALIRRGNPLSQVTEAIRTSMGVKARILPMSDEMVCTMIDTYQGSIHLQEYLVKFSTEPVISSITYVGSEEARPAPGVVEAIEAADGIILCPSNPLISIGPILSVRQIRQALVKRRSRVVAVSPIVGGKALKGPLEKMMAQLKMECSAAGVAKTYRDIAATFVLDTVDAAEKSAVEKLGMRAVVLPAVMNTLADKDRLAHGVLAQFARKAKRAHG